MISSPVPELDRDFDFLDELPRKGPGVVYRARDRELERVVTIRVIQSPLIRDQAALERLELNSGRVAKLHHPNILPLFEARALALGGVALVGGYLPGLTLREAIDKGGPVPVHFARKILHDVGRALAHAHRRHGVVHGRLRPDNVQLDTDFTRALLTDFEVLPPDSDESELALRGGSPAYLSPEQIDGLEPDALSDLYSLGLVGYAMLSGRVPWEGEGLYSVIYKQKHEELPPLTELRPELPLDLVRAIEGALRKERNARIPDVGTFLEVMEGKEWVPRESSSESGGVSGTAPFGGQDTFGDAAIGLGSAGVADAQWAKRAPGRSDLRLSPLEVPRGEGGMPAYGLVGGAPFGGPPFPGEGPPPPGFRRRWGALTVSVLLLLLVAGAAYWFLGDPEGGNWLGFGRSTGDAGEIGNLSPEAGGGANGALIGSSGGGILPAGLVTLEGEGQVAPPGEMVPMPVVVRVEDADGEPLPGMWVRFEMEEGRGAAIPPQEVTDELGRAQTRILMGPDPGVHRLTARLEHESVQAEVQIELTARSGDGPSALVAQVQPGREAPPATELPGGVVVRAQNASGQPVEGAEVRFLARGGGVVSPAVAITGADGVARADWILGPAAGEQSVQALIPDGPSLTLTARAVVELLAIRPTVAVGGTHSCRLSGDGSIACWGGNAGGQLGRGTVGGGVGPTQVAGPFSFASVAAGVSHTCALEREGRVLGGGDGSLGPLGAGGGERRAAPVEVELGVGFRAVTAGLSHTCALAASGEAYCWGANSRGQLGDGGGSSRGRPSPVAGGRSYSRLAAGWDHTCALTSGGAAYCWGANDSGQAGASGGSAPSPVPVPGEGGYSEIAAGATHSCALTREGVAYCWGDNRFGQLGDDASTGTSQPSRVLTSERFVQIAAGAAHSCGVTADGRAFCWGRNQFGQLGNGNTTSASSPVAVAGALRFSSIGATGSHTCGRTDTGATYCWGYNVEGQLGDGTRANQSSPVRAASP